MSRVLLAFAAVCVLGSPAFTQDRVPPQGERPPDRGKLKDNQYAIVVTGCVRGKRLERPQFVMKDKELPYDALKAESFALDVSKELTRQLQAHQDHEDEVTGIAIVPPSMSRGTAEVATKRIGPIRIGIGARQETSPLHEVPQIIKLKVQSFRHIDDRCVSALRE